jgi:hypothetical protein
MDVVHIKLILLKKISKLEDNNETNNSYMKNDEIGFVILYL